MAGTTRRDGLPYRTKAKRAEAVNTTELDAYKRLVREEAFRVQAEQGYCNDGLNRTLRTLGLPLKQEFTVIVEVTTMSSHRMTVDGGWDTDSADGARALARTWDKATIAAKLGLNADRIGDVTVPDPVPPSQAVKGGYDTTPEERDTPPYVGRRQCERYHSSGYTCTRPSGHDGQHVAGNGSHTRAVWEHGSADDGYSSYNQSNWKAWGAYSYDPEDAQDAYERAQQEELGAQMAADLPSPVTVEQEVFPIGA